MCAYISGLICLTANNLHNPHHETVDFDKQLVDTALKFVDEMVLKTNHEQLRRVLDACKELNQYVFVVVQKERHSQELKASHFDDTETHSSILQENVAGDTMQLTDRSLAAQFGDSQPFKDFGGTFWESLDSHTRTSDNTRLNDAEFGPNHVCGGLDWLG